MILGYGSLRLPGELGGYGRTVAPGPATGLSASANVTVPHVDLTWSAPTFGGAVDGYSINRSTDGVNYTNVGDSATTSFTDTTTAESTLYYYIVVAYNYSAGEAAASNVETITTGAAITVVKPDLTGWTFFADLEEGSGTVAANSGTLGSGFNGALLAAISGGNLPTWTVDEATGMTCLDFDKTGKVRFGKFGAPESGGSLSVIALVNPRSAGGSGLYPPIMNYGDYVSGSDRNGWYFWQSYSGSNIQCVICNGGSTQVEATSPDTALALNTWQMVSLIFDNAGDTLKVYINDTQVASIACTIAIGHSAVEYPTLGYHSDPGATTSAFGFDGKIAWVGVKRGGSAVTAGEISAIWSSLGL